MNKAAKEERQLRAALYARVSTEEQVEGYSLDAQRRAFRQFCEQKGWHAYREYVEKEGQPIQRM